MIKMRSVVGFVGLILCFLIFTNDCSAGKKIIKVPDDFRYKEDLETAATEHKGISNTNFSASNPIPLKIMEFNDESNEFLINSETDESKREEKGGGTKYQEDHHEVDEEKGDKVQQYCY